VNATPFWDWALSQYRAEAAQRLLLRLQEEAGLVILEALFVSWLASEHYEWRAHDTAKLRDATQDWIDEVVLPLRAVRQRWKNEASKEASRRHLLALEVEAERQLAELMWAASESARGEKIGAEQACKQSVGEQMHINLLTLPVFQDSKYVSEREQLVALLLQST
jgi:uncharacterized protein (TIGR02444 family)